MLAFAAIVGIVGFVQTQSDKPAARRLTAPARAISKPEPGSLLKRADLSLTHRECSEIQAIESRWSSDRAKLLTAMSAYQPQQGTADQIKGSLQGYSELSRDYDATRSRYWTMALSLLDAKQKTLVEGGSK